MKLLKCNKCGGNVSVYMTACGKCGEPNVHYESLGVKVIKIIGYLILAVIVLRTGFAILIEISDAIND